MKFVWEMTEKNWLNLVEDHNKKGAAVFSEDANMYGSCKVGTLCAEIVHTLDDEAWYTYTNVYALGIDDGYGETKSGIPYSLLNDGPAVPVKCVTFEDFKKTFETAFKNYIETNSSYIQMASQPLGNWD